MKLLSKLMQLNVVLILRGATIIDPKNFDNIDKYIDELVELRKK